MNWEFVFFGGVCFLVEVAMVECTCVQFVQLQMNSMCATNGNFRIPVI